VPALWRSGIFATTADAARMRYGVLDVACSGDQFIKVAMCTYRGSLLPEVYHWHNANHE
jgi:hypothetical protein